MNTIPDLTSSELQRFQVSRILDSIEGRRALEGIEGEFSREVERARPAGDPEAAHVPAQLLLDRQLSAGVQFEGAEVGRPPRLAGVISPTRPFSVVRRLGARVLYEPLPCDVPRFTEPVRAEFRVERPGVDADDSLPEFDLLQARGRMLTSTGVLTKMLARKSNAEAIYRRDMGKAVDALLDRVSLWGNGDVDPLGILDASRTGVGTVVSSGTPTLDHILQMEEAVAAADVDPEAVGYCASPQLRRKLAKTPKIEGGESMLWYGDTLNGRRAYASTDLRVQTSPPVDVLLFSGAWANLCIFIDPVITLIVDPYTQKKSGLLEVTLQMRADVLVERETAFCAIRDAAVE